MKKNLFLKLILAIPFLLVPLATTLLIGSSVKTKNLVLKHIKKTEGVSDLYRQFEEANFTSVCFDEILKDNPAEVCENVNLNFYGLAIALLFALIQLIMVFLLSLIFKKIKNALDAGVFQKNVRYFTRWLFGFYIFIFPVNIFLLLFLGTQASILVKNTIYIDAFYFLAIIPIAISYYAFKLASKARKEHSLAFEFSTSVEGQDLESLKMALPSLYIQNVLVNQGKDILITDLKVKTSSLEFTGRTLVIPIGLAKSQSSESSTLLLNELAKFDESYIKKNDALKLLQIRIDILKSLMQGYYKIGQFVSSSLDEIFGQIVSLAPGLKEKAPLSSNLSTANIDHITQALSSIGKNEEIISKTEGAFKEVEKKNALIKSLPTLLTNNPEHIAILKSYFPDKSWKQLNLKTISKSLAALFGLLLFAFITTMVTYNNPIYSIKAFSLLISFYLYYVIFHFIRFGFRKVYILDIFGFRCHSWRYKILFEDILDIQIVGGTRILVTFKAKKSHPFRFLPSIIKFKEININTATMDDEIFLYLDSYYRRIPFNSED